MHRPRIQSTWKTKLAALIDARLPEGDYTWDGAIGSLHGALDCRRSMEAIASALLAIHAHTAEGYLGTDGWEYPVCRCYLDWFIAQLGLDDNE